MNRPAPKLSEKYKSPDLTDPDTRNGMSRNVPVRIDFDGSMVLYELFFIVGNQS